MHIQIMNGCIGLDMDELQKKVSQGSYFTAVLRGPGHRLGLHIFG